MILIDLQKAFDNINHMLIQKMLPLGFANEVIYWFRSNQSSRKFHVNVHEIYSTSADLQCRVPQGPIHGPMLFQQYINDMPQAVYSNLFLYAQKSSMRFSPINLTGLWRTNLNLVLWTKLNPSFFLTKPRKKNVGTLDINYDDIFLKQYSEVTYLDCKLDESLSGEVMARLMGGLGSCTGKTDTYHHTSEKALMQCDNSTQ